MNRINISDFEYKKLKLRRYMAENGYEGAVVARRDNFAWFTFGGDNKIFRSTDVGYGILVVTMDTVFLIAQTMDADRIYDDELRGLDIEVHKIRWCDESREAAAMNLLRGKKIVSDIPIHGTDYRFDDFVDLHTPYTPAEIQRYHEVGALCDRMLFEIADNVRPGMTEQEIAAMILYAYGRETMVPKVLLVGSDERISKYRHPNASDKKLEQILLLAPAADKFGLHCNISRMAVYGNDIPKQLAEKYELLNQCLAVTASLCIPGTGMGEVVSARRPILEDAGLTEEYFNHYPGATTGYFMGSSQPLIENQLIKETQCFDWFITVTGAKVEELVMAGERGGMVLSAAGTWPVKPYPAGDYRCDLPWIYCK